MNIDLTKLSDVTLASIVADLHEQGKFTTAMFQVYAALNQRVGPEVANEMVEAMIAASEETPIMEWVVAQ
jgi:hypothetical protein